MALLNRLGISALLLAGTLFGQGPANVLVVVNDKSAISKSTAEYYVRARSIPLKNVCRINVAEEETVERGDYNRRIAAPVGDCLRRAQLVEQVLYIVTTQGVPLRVRGEFGLGGDNASVDSELTLLYPQLHGQAAHATKGQIRNPFFGKREEKFAHPAFPMYLVTRLAGYDFAGIRAMIDRSLAARNRGKFVIDLRSETDESGNDWLRTASLLLPRDRLVFDESPKVVLGQTDVIGYASWGSNDTNRKERFLNFRWLPGAIATEFVSTNARTFTRPPRNWTIGTWDAKNTWFFGSPQSMTADYLTEGASASTGHVDEPFLAATPRPEILLPAYYKGRTLAESYYLSIPYLSWQNVVIGDPLMSLGPPGQ